jgi:dihydropyrimidine dehydrogenase (NADP+)/dihydropyrimidine dehydrogenase (NAD+) subunit PreA
MGGIESGRDAAQFILLGCDTVQVCTYVMKVGYRCVRSMCDELAAFMEQHKFRTLADFKGHSLQYFTTHYDLVRLQAEARGARAAAAVKADHEWRGDDFVRQSDALARG